MNDGFTNLELTVRLPPDSSHLPISVSFPDGKLIGLAKERLPLEVRCCSSRPLSFTTTVDLLDEDGRAFSLVVTGASDNCSLSHAVFMQVSALPEWHRPLMFLTAVGDCGYWKVGITHSLQSLACISLPSQPMSTKAFAYSAPFL